MRRSRLLDTLQWARVHLPAAGNSQALASAQTESQRLPRELFSATVSEEQLAAWFHQLSDWLLLAFRAAKPGFANSYHLRNGWQGPHVETTGYTIPTAFAVARRTGSIELREAAMAASEWLLEWRSRDGAFAWFHPRRGYEALVFDNCQLLQGLLAAWRESEDPKWLEIATKTARWTVALQEKDGSWKRGSYNGIPHSYYVRAAWPLLQVAEAANDASLREAGIRHVEWAIAQIDEDGFPRGCGFLGETALTHTLAYFIEGLIECGQVLHEPRYTAVALRILDRPVEEMTTRGSMPGTFGPGWQANESFTCLPGNAQLALCCLKLPSVQRQSQHMDAAMRLLRATSSAAALDSNAATDGVRASFPVTGEYLPLTLPLWGAKFALDALLMADALKLVAIGTR